MQVFMVQKACPASVPRCKYWSCRQIVYLSEVLPQKTPICITYDFKIVEATTCWNESLPFFPCQTFLPNQPFCHLSPLFWNSKYWALLATGGDGRVLNKELERNSCPNNFSVCGKRDHKERMEIEQHNTFSWIDRLPLWRCKWHPKMYHWRNLQSLRCCQTSSNRLQNKWIPDVSKLLAGGV